MKRPVIITAALGLALAPAAAQINKPDAQGYLDRGIALLEADRNYAGCIDQLARLHAMQLTPGLGAMQQELLDKHYLRKHGPGAYYGQG